jgi:AraC-like DNA-binding protein
MTTHDHDHRREDTLHVHHNATSRVIIAMHDRADGEFRLEEMAEIGIMSPFHFNRVFGKITGIPPCLFFRALRLEYAKRLLVTTATSVTEICWDLGYQSLGTFTRRFTELVGLPPRRMRVLAREMIPSFIGATVHAAGEQPAPSDVSIQGTVSAPVTFRGAIFVGLFGDPVPQRFPFACAVLAEPGPFALAAVPSGKYYLFAVGIPADSDTVGAVVMDSALRAGEPDHPVDILVQNPPITAQLTLRDAKLEDPPILPALALIWRAAS